MRYLLSLCTFLCVLNASAEDARAFLETSLAKFSNLSSYYIEGTREDATTDAIQRDWHKEVFTIAKAPGKRYRFDIKKVDMWNVVVSNGTSEWDFQPWLNEFMQRPTPDLTHKAGGPDDAIHALAARYAQNYVDDVANQKIASAEFLPDEVITLASEPVSCRVVRATIESPEDAGPADPPAQVTFWIEKQTGLLRRERIASLGSTSTIQPLRHISETIVTSYARIDLSAQPSDSLFVFTPPTGAKQVSRLFLDRQSVDLTGLPAPALKLKTFDGHAFDAESLKGHPVLIDFWSSWCVPCVQQMPLLAALNERYRKLGLIVIGIDWNDEPKDATEFLRRHNYGWINLRDVNGETAKGWMLNGVPLLAIIDPAGKIAYYHGDYQQPEEEAIVDTLMKIDSRFSPPAGGSASRASVP